jgi:PAS domain S-box-containing protein
MGKKPISGFFMRIVLPSILAIVFFVLILFSFIIPTFEKNLMERKKEMIRELTHATWSILGQIEKNRIRDSLSISDAQELAIKEIEYIRYGPERKDYFWIIDNQPVMIMHPYRPDMNGNNLEDYADPNGIKLFVESVQVVEEKGEGYVSYNWQWKDDSNKVVPKLSYVKGFEPWGWIIGTGIYIEDVKEEIRSIESRLIWLSLLITVIVGALLFYISRQSLSIELKKKQAEENLRNSRMKYKKLVDASTDGTLMIVANKIVYANSIFQRISGYTADELLKMEISEVFGLLEQSKVLNELFSEIESVMNTEVILKHKGGEKREIVLTISKINYQNEPGYIVVSKDVSKQRQIEKEVERIQDEVQTSLLLMNQPVKNIMRDFFTINMNQSIHDAAMLMNKKKQSALIVVSDDNKPIGMVDEVDFKNRVAVQKIDFTKEVHEIMSSPVRAVDENAVLYEALMESNKNDTNTLAVRSKSGVTVGILSIKDLLNAIMNNTNYFIQEINNAEQPGDLKIIYNKLPALINSLIKSGARARNITRIVTSFSDSITDKLINLAIEKLGQPPARFAFISLGSEGRMEQTLYTDQDNAIVFEDQQDKKSEEEVQQYFLKLAETVNTWLHKTGYSYCKGDFMARNPTWCCALSKWKKYYQDWVEEGDPQSLMDAAIFFDFRKIYGNLELFDLRKHINEVLHGESVFFYHMSQNTQRFKPPVNLFGNIVSVSDADNNESFDIKKVIASITGFARIYALQKAIELTNTLERLQEIQRLGVINKEMGQQVEQAYEYLMLLRFENQVRAILNSEEPGNMVPLGSLTDLQITSLKKIFSQISELCIKLNADFKGSY